MSYTVLSGVEMSAGLHRAAAIIAEKLDFDITITSGIRSAREQARAMLGIIASGGNQALLDTYKDDAFAQGVIDAAGDLDQATQFVKTYFAQGRGSSHGRAQGLDIRTTGGGAGASNRLSSIQIQELIQAVSGSGYTYLREYHPPHLHVTIPVTEKKMLLPILLLLGIGAWILK